MKSTSFNSGCFVVLLTWCLSFASCTKKDDPVTPQIFSYLGDIKPDVDDFRNLLGVNNINSAGSQPSGRREINWDALPDSLAAPNGYNGNFFNDPSNHQARGVEFTTPGTELLICADLNNPTNTPASFGNINATYTAIFPTFSGERMISPIGSNVMDVRFYIPGTSTPAVVRGVGAVLIDTDKAETSSFELFDNEDNALGTYFAPVMNNGQVFLGLLFDTPLIHHIRITLGNKTLGPDDGGSIDVSVMDDFIFAEPQPIP